MQTLAVVVITLNEERNIGRCLASVQGLADEIIVLDAFSNDQTVTIAQTFGAQVIQREWKGYSNSKNYLNSLVQSDYILSLDADEALSPELKNSLLNIKQKGFEGTYSVNRLTNYLGKWIYHCGWFPDIKPRLFPKEGSYWEGEFVHEELRTPFSEEILLDGVLEHYSYYSFEDHRARADKYSALTAQKFFAAGKKASFLKPYVSAVARFLSMYVIKKGFLDGKMGFKIAWISAQSNVFKYKELIRLHREHKRNSN